MKNIIFFQILAVLCLIWLPVRTIATGQKSDAASTCLSCMTKCVELVIANEYCNADYGPCLPAIDGQLEGKAFHECKTGCESKCDPAGSWFYSTNFNDVIKPWKELYQKYKQNL